MSGTPKITVGQWEICEEGGNLTFRRGGAKVSITPGGEILGAPQLVRYNDAIKLSTNFKGSYRELSWSAWDAEEMTGYLAKWQNETDIDIAITRR
ncbi:hypothetical protein [Kitasatospora sp. NPDC004531]